MSVFFTSDLHFGHKNIIQYCNRPFTDMEHMNAELIRRWNAVVSKEDEVYFLGDVSFTDLSATEKLLTQLQGRIYLVPGNHDSSFRRKPRFQECFDKIFPDLTEVVIEQQHIVLCHFPLLSWNRMSHGSWHLHGHSHGALKFTPLARRLDVGVDAGWSYAPVSFVEVKAKMSEVVAEATRPDRIQRNL